MDMHVADAAISIVVAWRVLPDFARIAYRPASLKLRTPFIAGVATVVACVLIFALPDLRSDLLTVLTIIMVTAFVGTLFELFSLRRYAPTAFGGTLRVIDAYNLVADALMMSGLLALAMLPWR